MYSNNDSSGSITYHPEKDKRMTRDTSGSVRNKPDQIKQRKPRINTKPSVKVVKGEVSVTLL